MLVICSLLVVGVLAFDEFNISQPADHFGFTSEPVFFNQSYYVDKRWCNDSTCPILFFVGGESAIQSYVNETYSGFVWQLSQKLGAKLVFAEHRYYGSSIPLSSFSYQYLSSQQALADFALLASNLSSASSPSRVIAVGGSYSGMLAVWLRQKFPNVFYGAFAASAPVFSFQTERIDIDRFYEIVSNDFEATCREGVRQGFEELLHAAQTGEFALIKKSFQLCEQPGSTEEAINLISLLQQVFTNYAQGDYPFPRGGLPGNPTQVACKLFMEAKGGMTGLSSAASLSLNSSPCVAANLSEWQAFIPGFIPGVWTFQRCTEIVIASQVQDRVNQSMFLPCSILPENCWNITSLRAFCKREFGVTLPENNIWARVDHELTSASLGLDRILFSNGILDPWSFAGVSEANNSLWMVGAHHADLCLPNPADHPTVVAARTAELNVLTEWLSTSR